MWMCGATFARWPGANGLASPVAPQPKMKKRKSVTKLDAKDVINDKTSKYVLTHQDQDSQGEVETHMVKVRTPLHQLLSRLCPPVLPLCVNVVSCV